MKQKIDLDYLRRCKYSSPEDKFKWMESALVFYKAKKVIVKNKKKD